MTTIELYEDNTGGLYLWDDVAKRGFDVTKIQQQASFREDAAALAAGRTTDWTVPALNEYPGCVREHSHSHDCCALVATWTEHGVKLMDDSYGVAAAKYLGLPRD